MVRATGAALAGAWWLQYALPGFLASAVTGWVDQALGLPAIVGVTETAVLVDDPTGPLQLLVGLALVVPGVSSIVARLHGQGDSAWRLLVLLIPLVGVLLLLVLVCSFRGDRVPNRYGPPPGPLRRPCKPAQRPAEQPLQPQRR